MKRLGKKKVANSVYVVSVYDFEDGVIVSKDPIFNIINNGVEYEPIRTVSLDKRFSISLKFKQGSICYGYTNIKFGNSFEYVFLQGKDEISKLGAILKSFVGEDIGTKKSSNVSEIRDIVKNWIFLDVNKKEEFMLSNPSYFRPKGT